jgi:hypothetical protein
MAILVAWLGNLGTIKASGLQPYLSAVNKFYKDHGRELVALGDMVARVRKGLPASQVSLAPALIRVLIPVNVVLLALLRAKVVRLDILQLSTTDAPRITVEILRICVATIKLLLFFSRGGAWIECLTGDLVTTQDGIILYHRDRKSQRGVTIEHRLLCAIPGNTHIHIASLVDIFDILRLASSNKTPPCGWAIDTRDKPTNWLADTLTSWILVVLRDIKANPREGFAWTSHSLRKRATTAVYAIRVNMQ